MGIKARARFKYRKIVVFVSYMFLFVTILVVLNWVALYLPVGE
jgi:hypothetical protein